MKMIFSLLTLSMVLFSSTAWSQPALDWGVSYGGSGTESVADQVVDANGMIYTVGLFSGTVDFNPGPSTYNLTSNGGTDIFVSKFDGDGNLIWAVNIGWGNDDGATDIDLDAAGNIVLTGFYEGTVDFDPGVGVANMSAYSSGSRGAFVLKLTSNGQYLWAKSSNRYTVGAALTVSSNGSIYVGVNVVGAAPSTTLTFGSGYTFAAYAYDYMVWKLNDNGSYSWIKAGTGSSSPIANKSMISDASGNVVIGCTFSNYIQLSAFSGPQVFAVGGQDAIVFKLNASGNHVWNRPFGSSTTVQCAALHKVDDTKFYVGGQFMGSVNFNPPAVVYSHTSNGSFDSYIVEMDFDNNVTMTTSYGGTAIDRLFDITTASNGDIYACGGYSGTTDLDGSVNTDAYTSQGYYAYLLKLNASGQYAWGLSFGSSGDEYFYAMSHASGALFCSGDFQGTIDFDPDVSTLNLTSNGNGDVVTLKFTECLPSAPVPDASTLIDLVAECSVSLPSAPTASNCTGVYSGIPDVPFPLTASTTITWTYDDGNGNTSTQTQEVIINDNTAPVADVVTLADVNAQCEVTSLTAPTATDNCAGTIVGTHNASLPISSSTTITWTYDDGNGNTSTQTQEVIIDDVTAPVADEVSLADVTAQCEITSLTAPTATDNCEGSITGTHNASLPVSSSTTITWTYDDGNGNTSTQTQEVVITPVDNSVTMVNGVTLSADASGYTYQWVDCDNANSPISGETDQTLVASSNGNYAVEIDNGSCTVTSDCIQILTVGIQNPEEKPIRVYPNPNDGTFYIEFSRFEDCTDLRLIDANGRLIYSDADCYAKRKELDFDLVAGIYILEIQSKNQIERIRLVVQ